MKRIDIQIWKYLMDERGYYVSSEEMCRDLGLSRRQLLTRVTKSRYPYVVKDVDGTERKAYFKLDCGDTEAQACTIRILADYYNHSESSIRALVESIPTDGTVTLEDIKATGTDFTIKDLINIMSMMPCIEVTKSWSKNRYRRTGDV